MAYIFEHSTELNPNYLIELVDTYKNVNLFKLGRYYDRDHVYDNTEHLVFGTKDKKSAMKVLIECYFLKIFSKWDKKLKSLWEFITKKYEFGTDLIKDIQKFWILISKESIDIERIEYFLVENAEDLIIDLTWSILNAYKYQTTCSEVIEYLIRKYPREYYKNYKVKSSARGYKSLDSFF